MAREGSQKHITYYITLHISLVPMKFYKTRKTTLKLELAKYYKDSKMTDYISERSRNSK